MKIRNYDVEDDFSSNYIQKVSFMPDRCFRMLICAPSGGGKTNLLLDMIYRLVYYDKIYLYAKNLQQNKYHIARNSGHLSPRKGMRIPP